MAEPDLAAAFDRFLPLVAGRIAADGGTVAGPPFGWYHLFGPDVVDVEIGFPVGIAPTGLTALTDSPPGEVGRSELPGGEVATAVVRGPYDRLPAAYDALHEWIHARPDVDDGDGPWESYLVDARTVSDPSDLETRLNWPLVRT
jgi:effector-binding domain-containing protein